MAAAIGVLGSGIVGQVLANGFIRHGYDVMIGTNNAGKHEELRKATGGKAQIGSFADTARFGNIIVLATKGSASRSALDSAGAANLKGKTVIDTTNPIAEAPPVNGVLKFFTTLDESLMEQLQKSVPDAHFVKAFSCVGNAFMVNPDFNGVKPTMFMCGNHEPAKKEVCGILERFGWEIADMGKAEAARAIEPLCILWCIPGLTQNSWMHAFKLLKK
jgi:predicted dinucleotide-binding enzyme